MLYRAIAYLYQQWEYGLVLLNRIRRNVLIPVALWGGRDMLLLKNGSWADRRVDVPVGQVQSRYSVERHAVETEEGARTTRWPWLSVVDASGRDMSDWFGSLRLTRGQNLSADKALMLFAHQKGWMPTGPLRVMGSDGEEQFVDAVTGIPIPAEEERVANVLQRVESVNHIS